MAKYLIINADDFGMSKIFNEVILDLINRNLITSTSVLVNREGNNKEQFDQLVSVARAKNVSVGLHIEFKDKNYKSQIESQYVKFKHLIGSEPSHIDIHKARHFKDSFSLVADFCRKNNFPCRNRGKIFEKLKTTAVYAFFGSLEQFEEIEEWIKTLKDDKYYEILFHPGKFDPECKSSLNKERERDIEHIKNLNSIAKNNNIKIISYLDLK